PPSLSPLPPALSSSYSPSSPSLSPSPSLLISVSPSLRLSLSPSQPLSLSLPPAFGAVLQGSLFGLAGLLPASYTTPIMSGQGLAGTFAAVSMIIATGSALTDSAFGYFITACVVILLAIASYLALPRLEFFKYYSECHSPKPTTDEENKMDLLVKENAVDTRPVTLTEVSPGQQYPRVRVRVRHLQA
ncbi:hypothetical protein AAFF_G00124810, partial [Aldrovandia affinis]